MVIGNELVNVAAVRADYRSSGTQVSCTRSQATCIPLIGRRATERLCAGGWRDETTGPRAPRGLGRRLEASDGRWPIPAETECRQRWETDPSSPVESGPPWVVAKPTGSSAAPRSESSNSRRG
jgi:hypothetical protein